MTPLSNIERIVSRSRSWTSCFLKLHIKQSMFFLWSSSISAHCILSKFSRFHCDPLTSQQWWKQVLYTAFAVFVSVVHVMFTVTIRLSCGRFSHGSELARISIRVRLRVRDSVSVKERVRLRKWLGLGLELGVSFGPAVAVTPGPIGPPHTAIIHRIHRSRQ